MEELYKKLIEKLVFELNSNDTNFLDEFFAERSDTLYHAIAQNKDYKLLFKEIKQVDNRIENDFENNKEIMKIIEEHQDTMNAMSALSEKLMYKYGLRDGINLIISVLKYHN